jgi:putative ABC transport system substrate-binding protein
VDRRRFMLTSLAGALAAPLAAGAQPTKILKIGVLSGDFPNDSPCVERVRRGLSDLGYVEGRTHVLELRWAEGRTETFPRLAADLVKLKVDLIVSAAGPAALAVKEATTTIPIVLASSFYPVETGVIASLAHPGGNVTGVTHFTPDLMAKRVQLLKEAVPRASRASPCSGSRDVHRISSCAIWKPPRARLVSICRWSRSGARRISPQRSKPRSEEEPQR